ncbi:MAG: SDR family NAD(P)-dependent oxidoreductase [Propioniciclava sp.]
MAAGEVVAVFGGRSEIGVEVAKRLAAGAAVALVVRPESDVTEAVASVEAAGARTVAVERFDADLTQAHRTVVDAVEQRLGPITTAVLAFGILGDQTRAEHDEAEVVTILHTDFVAQASLLTILADRMRRRGAGRLVVFSSVAGVRVRRANYVYGSAKAGLDGFATGLADALHGTGVDVVLARPGFVIGRMTHGMRPAVLASTPPQVADAVAARIAQGGSGIIWIPRRLRALFAVARLVPRALWRRTPR